MLFNFGFLDRTLLVYLMFARSLLCCNVDLLTILLHVRHGTTLTSMYEQIYSHLNCV